MDRKSTRDIVGLLSFILVFLVLFAVTWAVLAAMEFQKTGGVAHTALVRRSSSATPQTVYVPPPSSSSDSHHGGGGGGGGDLEIVYVYALWCGACKHARPVWDKWSTVAAPKRGIVTRAVDHDQNHSFVTENNIQFLPTVLAMRNGKKVGVYAEGNLELEKLNTWVDHVAKQQRVAHRRK